jgi:hypothetical protein
MEKMELEDFDQELPDRMNLAVIMEKQPSTHPWADFRYDAIGAVVRDGDEEKSITRRAFPGHGPESATTSGRMRELLP